MMKTGGCKLRGAVTGTIWGAKGSTYLYPVSAPSKRTLRRKMLAPIQLHLNGTRRGLQQGNLMTFPGVVIEDRVKGCS